jgi:hypothetical protein
VRDAGGLLQTLDSLVDTMTHDSQLKGTRHSDGVVEVLRFGIISVNSCIVRWCGRISIYIFADSFVRCRALVCSRGLRCRMGEL